MTVRLLPDTLLLCVEAVRAHADVQALCAQRVWTRIPADPTWPLVTLERVGGTTVRPEHIDRPQIQYAAWGDLDDPDAEPATGLLARTVQAVLHEQSGTDHSPDGVICDVTDVLSPFWLPDTDSQPARPRWMGQVAVTVHV